ncbi:PAS domain S-box-containing protein [Catalinimonas alkaloidigena]|uniref:histidine kinase n=1 Tax=Catalinimonas alkaloidigena TaxID=1075417 RepID=A0A1G9BDV6_9BACT|nr:PAS domain S-box protein [Catalinimonas alkaloidigena]SDK37691.1 PAS domain S-box-containing protein [Catalinimonas alkaloidigena]
MNQLAEQMFCVEGPRLSLKRCAWTIHADRHQIILHEQTHAPNNNLTDLLDFLPVGSASSWTVLREGAFVQSVTIAVSELVQAGEGGHLICITPGTEQTLSAAVSDYQQLRFASAISHISDLILSDDTEKVYREMVNIVGKALEMERCSVYEVNDTQGYLKEKFEWVDQESDPSRTSSLVSYPLKKFKNATEYFRKEKKWLVSHKNQPLPLLVQDGSWQLLHEEMDLGSIYAFPFHFRPGKYLLLIAHRHQELHRLSPEELEFVEAVIKQVSISLNQSERENKYRFLSENSTDVVLLLDLHGRYKYISQAAKEVYGYEPDELLGREVFEFVHPDDAADLHALFAEKRAEQVPFMKRYRRRRKDGTYVWMEYTVKMVYRNRRLVGVQAAGRDITERKRVEEALVVAKEQAEALAKTKEMFLSTMSHEIRTPLNAVIGFVHLLLDENPRPDQRDTLNALQFSAKQLYQLLNDILDLNKIDAGKIALESIAFKFQPLLEGLEKSFVLRAKQKSIALRTDIDPALPEVVQGDPVRLMQILTNLLSNAIKFTEQGSVTLRAQVEEETDTHVWIRFSVIDTGIGIPADKRDAIFESFTQASPDIARRFAGTGLGLAITKKLIQLQGGDIAVESVEGQGSTFSFNLKMEKGHPDQVQENEAKATVDLTGVRLLVAEDNEINREVVGRFLSKWHIKADYALNGQEAVDMWEQPDVAYDLLLMDLHMPHCDGFEAAAKIRALERQEARASIPIVAFTASASSAVQEKILQAGMDDFIPKPFKPVELYNVIAKHIRPQTTTERPPMPSQINFSNLVEISNDDPVFLVSLVHMYIKALRQFEKEIREALLMASHDRVREVSHRHWGTLLSLEVEALIKLVESSKQQVKDPNYDSYQATALVNRIAELVGEMIRELQTHLPDDQESLER